MSVLEFFALENQRNLSDFSGLCRILEIFSFSKLGDTTSIVRRHSFDVVKRISQ